MPTPDGRSVLFLRSGPRDTRQRLFRLDVATGAVTELAAPPGGPETLSVEEKARRERARMTLTGITDFALSDDGRVVLASEGGRLLRISLPDGAVRSLPGQNWIAPRLSPDGRHAVAVRQDDLHLIDLDTGQERALTSGGDETRTRGLAEFAAAEELARSDGSWWSPDGRTILFEEADSTAVEKHFIADPSDPAKPPVEFRYPRAGTTNARVRLMLLSPDGGGSPRPVDWDSESFPYLARVVWPAGGPLSLVVLNRAQTEERLLAVDPRTGATRTLLSETDPAWVNISPDHGHALRPLPRWLAGNRGFLWASERDGDWRLERHRPDGALDRVLTPKALPFVSLEGMDRDGRSALVRLAPDRLDSAVYRLDLASGALRAVASEPGLHEATVAPGGHALTFVDRLDGADGDIRTLLRDGEGRMLGTIPSVAEPLPVRPRTEFLQAGSRGYDSVVVRPADFAAGRRYPVVLWVYAGPGSKMVNRTPRAFAENQCLANRGFIVVSLDGRGTPGRGRDWERAIHDDLIDVPLADQVDGLKALGARFPEMDLSRVGVTGWSFGGYFTAMAVARRPDIFRAGVAGAPVVDFGDYDTAYTERYLGLPSSDPEGYRRSDVLSYAPGLSRPLLILHGLTDDNVYFSHTVKLTEALTRAGKPYELMLLPGTHLLSDPVLRTAVSERRAAFLSEWLATAKQ
ncbi:prolyl oligopeptidase family serine peptidase [Rhizosaccharibacter radicis]|uniref:Prolyl oligopeptidase family serine peptidase n=1 Tax=Rhizosaccharibacter radicis TaxID=2782605 RepID=A0ABT1VUN2_9PROT|nr:prolyl oligopeptidase family serine peptidase [Acetobacteraceae bacterium KSS12]